MADTGAAACQPLGHIRRSTALLFLVDQVKNPYPDRVDPLVHRVPPVAAFVPPLFVLRVGGRPVNLDASAVFRIQVVQVPIACRMPDPRLPCRNGQPMGALDAPHVTEFEDGERAALGVAKSQLDILPSLDPRTRQQCHPDARGRGPPAPDGAADPAVCLFEAARAVDEVKHRLLDPGTRWLGHRMPGMLQ
jgi:hypothetical protein